MPATIGSIGTIAPPAPNEAMFVFEVFCECKVITIMGSCGNSALGIRQFRILSSIRAEMWSDVYIALREVSSFVSMLWLRLRASAASPFAPRL